MGEVAVTREAVAPHPVEAVRLAGEVGRRAGAIGTHTLRHDLLGAER